MRSAVLSGVLLMAVLFALAAAAGADERSTVLLREECQTEIAWRETTLFANGTIRLRTHDAEGESMSLGELTGEQTRAYLNRLAAEDLSEVDRHLGGAEGDWVERCMLELALPEMPERSFRYGDLETRSLGLSRLLLIVGELTAKARQTDSATDGLPHGYEPRPGDRLRRVDGELFEVLGRTADGRGVELQGVELPLTIFIGLGDLRRHFVEVESRRRPGPGTPPE